MALPRALYSNSHTVHKCMDDGYVGWMVMYEIIRMMRTGGDFLVKNIQSSTIPVGERVMDF